MPRIVDREKVRKDILSAFEECIRDKPIANISLRDIAKKAHMTHPTLLNYFQTKKDIILAYNDYTKQYMAEHCEKWFEEHSHNDYPSKLEYMNAFMRYVAEGGIDENRPQASIQTYILGKYDEDISKILVEQFIFWRMTMEKCLKGVYGDCVGSAEAEAMMVLIVGTFICNYNNALTGAINCNMISQFLNLS